MTDEASIANFSVLLVDDDDVELEGMQRSFKKHGVNCSVLTAGDGVEALEILRREHPSKVLKAPYFVLLDLNMPRMNGFEFLEVVRADPVLNSTVIFVLTTSSRDTDRMRVYHECAAGYMVKSAVGPQFSKLALLLRNYGAAVLLPDVA